MKYPKQKLKKALLYTAATATLLLAASAQTTSADTQAPATAVSQSTTKVAQSSSSVISSTTSDATKSDQTTVSDQDAPATAEKSASATTKAKPVKKTAQGPWIAADEYVTVTSKGYNTWGSFNWTNQLAASSIYQHTYHVTGQYHHENGSTYLSLYTANGGWAGYINAKAVTVAAGPQGIWRKASGYATLNQANQLIYSNFSDKVVANSNALLNKTYHLTGVYHTYNQETIYSLGDDNGKWLGYMKAGSFTTSTKAQGPWQTMTGYFEVTSGNYNFWKDFSWHAGASTKSRLNRYVTVNGEYHHVNGSVYYSCHDNSGKWLGYLNANVLKGPATSPQGAWHADDQYVTITSKNYALYSGFNWKVAKFGSQAYLETLHATGKYYHVNGSTYLSLYNNQGKWQGYINQKAVKNTGKQGAWRATSGYTTFTSSATALTSSVEGTAVKTSAKTLAGNTYKITGMYHTYEGKTIYSVYSNKNAWLGYVDASKIQKTANAQGLWMAHNGYITTTKKGQKIWSSLKFTSGISTSTYYQITYQVKGMYHHFNGSTYYSLYKNGGHWLGYVNKSFVSEVSGAQGAWLSNNYSVMVTKNGYPVWGTFFGNQKTTSDKLRGNIYRATGKYHHLNGSTYLSLYSGSKWIGYINAAATTPAGSKVLNVAYASQFKPYYAPEGCAAVSLYMALRYKGVKSVSQKYLLDHLPMYPIPGGQKCQSVYSTAGFVSVIQPSALTAYAHNWYKGAKNITGQGVSKIMQEILMGNPVEVWGFSPYHAASGTRTHTHLVVGYDSKKGFKIYDPAYNSAFSKPGSAAGGVTDRGAVYWISVGAFTTESGSAGAVAFE